MSPMPAETDRVRDLAVPAVLSPAAVDAFDASLDRLVAGSPDEVVLSCNLDYITSSHIGLMWQASRACADAGIRLRLGSPSAGLLRVLHTLDLCQFFAIGADDPDDSAVAPRSASADRGDDTVVYEHVFHASAESVDCAIKRFVGFLEALGLPESLRFELRTVFYEVAYNIYLHSGLAPDADISVRGDAAPHGLRLTFSDAGVPFDPTRAHTVSTFIDVARDRQKRGLGLPMLGKLTDRMTYTRTDQGRNVLSLDKTWGDSSD